MAAGKTDHALERLVFFSDAVFAIAITLLVIEIHPPHLERGAPIGEQVRALAQLIPNFVGFAVSFTVIGAFWAGHHRAFTLAGRYDGRILIWNLLLLGAIAFMPFVTGFQSINYDMRLPAGIYWGWMVLTALLNVKVNRIATSPPMLGADVPAEAAREVPRRSRSVALAAVTAFLLSFVSPLAAPAAMATIPLWMRLLRRRDRG